MSNFNSNKILNRMFRRIHGLVWDLSTGSIGVKTESGIVSLTQDLSDSAEGEAPTIVYGTSINPFDGFGTPIPAFATQTAQENVKDGDLIVGDKNIIGWVIGRTASAFKVLDHNGNTKTYTPPKVAIMNTQGVLVVQNLMNLAGGQAGLGGLAGGLMPLLMLGGSEDKLEKILPILLMQQSMAPATAGAAPAANPMVAMMPLMLMKQLSGEKGGKSDIDPMMLMAMSGGLGGGAGGMNPMMMLALLGEGGLDGVLGGSASPTPLPAPGIPPLQRLR